MHSHRHDYDLCVIGAGMAGMAAALFAANRGLRTAMCGSVGGVDFSTGPLDLLAVHPVAAKRVWDDPWAALDALAADQPDHPYNKVGKDRVRAALDEFCAFMADTGVIFKGRDDRNVSLLTPAGTLKKTYRVPRSMWNGVLALEEGAPTLIVGFQGLKGFSARQIEQVRKPHWPALRAEVLPFPGFRGELYAEHLAMALADPETRRKLAGVVRPHIQDAAYVGFPSSLGLYGAGDVRKDLEERLGARIFEIPTLPPSVTGLRLRAAFEKHLPAKGVTVFSQKLVSEARPLEAGGLACTIVGQAAVNKLEPRVAEQRITARAVLHAGGRFFGKGLQAGRTRIDEPVLGLPVHQPESREQWHAERFFAPDGHPVNQAGLLVDDRFRPVDRSGRVVMDNVFAAGSILAHQDWARQKCGAGLAISTALAAVEAAAANLADTDVGD